MKKTNYPFAIALILCLGAILRFLGLGAKSFRLQEHTLNDLIMQGSWKGFFSSFNGLVGYGWNPLNPFFCQISGLLGTGESIIRLPSALFGVVCIYVVYRLGKSLFSYNTGIIAASLLAFSPMAVAWSQEARYFSLAQLLCTLSALLLIEALRERKWAWAGLVMTQVALLLTTYQGGSVLVMEGLFLCLPVFIPSLRWKSKKNPLKPLIYFLVSAFISVILLSPWFYYEIENDFRIGRAVADTLAGRGSYGSFLDWGGGSVTGFLFCLFFFLMGMLGPQRTPEPGGGETPQPDNDTSGPKTDNRITLLPLTLAGIPAVLALAGIFRGDQIFISLPFFLLIAAKGMDQISAIIHSKAIKRKLILPVFLGGYFLLQIVPIYNLKTNRKHSFIPKPDWKKATAYLSPHLFNKRQAVLLDSKGDLDGLLRYLRQSIKELHKRPDYPLKNRRPTLYYPQDDLFHSLALNEMREGFFIQSPDRGILSGLISDPLFSPYFTPAVSLTELSIYRYRLPILVTDDTHSPYHKIFSDMSLTDSQDFKRQLLFMEAGSYMVAFQSMDNIPAKFSISFNGEKAADMSTDSHGIGSYKIQAGRGERDLLFRLIEPDTLRLKWLGVHRLRKDHIAFQAEYFNYKTAKDPRLIRKIEFGGRTAAVLYVNGSIGYYFALAEGGEFQLELEGYNTIAGAVEIAVELDGERLGVLSFDKADRSWGRLRMPLSISPGIHRIAFAFINDKKIKDRDKNALLDRFELNRIEGK